MPSSTNLFALLILSCLWPAGHAATLSGTVLDSRTSEENVVKVPLVASDVLTYRALPNGTPQPFTIIEAQPGYFFKQVDATVDYELYFAVAGYGPEFFEVKNMNGSSAFIDPVLTRSSHLSSLTFAGNPSSFYDDDFVTGTITLSGPFPKAATVVDLSVLVGDGSRVELQDTAGTALVGNVIEIPAGDTAASFRLAGKPDAAEHPEEVLGLQATAAAIPAAGNQVSSPQITLRDARRSVSLDFGGLEGVVHRYDVNDQSLVDSVATSSGAAVLKGVAPVEAAVFVFTPGAPAD